MSAFPDSQSLSINVKKWALPLYRYNTPTLWQLTAPDLYIRTIPRAINENMTRIDISFVTQETVKQVEIAYEKIKKALAKTYPDKEFLNCVEFPGDYTGRIQCSIKHQDSVLKDADNHIFTDVSKIVRGLPIRTIIFELIPFCHEKTCGVYLTIDGIAFSKKESSVLGKRVRAVDF